MIENIIPSFMQDREIIYVMNPHYIQLVTDYKNGDATAQEILNNLDFYIVPSLNVDGYAYTWKVCLMNTIV